MFITRFQHFMNKRKCPCNDFRPCSSVAKHQASSSPIKPTPLLVCVSVSQLNRCLMTSSIMCWYSSAHNPGCWLRVSRLTLKSVKISRSENVFGSTSPHELTLSGGREYTTIQKLRKSSGVIVRKIAGMPNFIRKEK